MQLPVIKAVKQKPKLTQQLKSPQDLYRVLEKSSNKLKVSKRNLREKKSVQVESTLEPIQNVYKFKLSDFKQLEQPPLIKDPHKQVYSTLDSFIPAVQPMYSTQFKFNQPSGAICQTLHGEQDLSDSSSKGSMQPVFNKRFDPSV